MTDYLEPQEREAADVLLEAERRLEDLLAGTEAGEREDAPSALDAAEEAPKAWQRDVLRMQDASHPERGTDVKETAQSTSSRELEAASASAWQEQTEEPEDPTQTARDEAAGELPLLSQMEELEGAVLAVERIERGGGHEPGRQASYGVGETTYSGRRIGNSKVLSSGGVSLAASGDFDVPGGKGGDMSRRLAGRPSWGEETLRAEELDRALQRDSRRYDGGFFLY